MVIARRALEDFLNRPADNHSWLKSLSVQELDEIIDDINPKPEFSAPLDHAQKVGFILGIAYNGFVLHLDMGCVDCETEYLSPTGWKRIDQYDGGKVAQYWTETGKADFVQPLSYIVEPCEFMYKLETSRGGVNQKITPDHRVLYADYREMPKVTTAQKIYDDENNLALGWRGRFFSSFYIDTKSSLDISDSCLRVQVAVIADGSFPRKTNYCNVRVKKDRKKIRMRELLRNAEIVWREHLSCNDEYTIFSFSAPRRDKEFDEWYWKANQHQLQVISDECRYWDGSTIRGVRFFSRSEKSADFIQYAFCATNKTARLLKSVRQTDVIDYYITSREKPMLLYLRGVDNNGVKTTPISIEKTTDGRKYCFRVPSSFLIFRRNGCVFVSGNCGKTIVSLELIKWYFKCNLIHKVLVFTPTDEVATGWADEINKWNMNIPYIVATGSSKDKWYSIRYFERGIIIGTYVGISTMVSRKKTVIKGYKKITYYEPDKNLLAEFSRGIDGLVMDESTRVGNHDTLSYKVCKALSLQCRLRLALAGRLFGRDPLKAWSQVFLADHGESFGRTLSMFREAFFTSTHGRWGGMEYSLNPKREKAFSRFLGHRTIQYSLDDLVDLEERVPVVMSCQFPDDMKRYYKRCIDEVIRAKGKIRELDNVFIRMRQVSSGFVGVVDDELDIRTIVEFPHNPKLNLLMELLEEIPENRKAIIFHEFTWSGKTISRNLRNLKIPHGWLYGETKDWDTIKDRFNNDPEYRFLIINNKKGILGLNLQIANYAFFYESPVSVIDRSQAEARIRRKGQQHKQFIYDLVVKGSMDEKILDFHKQGESLFEALVRDPASVLS